MSSPDVTLVPGSFRDPNGFMFRREGQLYRQVNRQYQAHYDRLMTSGLYESLAKEGMLILHEEVPLTLAATDEAYKVLRPTPLPFISHPYEWSFSQLQDAALLTLQVQQRAVEAGMVLKDASAYNVQFWQGRPVLIDTLSFETYREGEPWVAYRQFCQHFLAPLALMSYVDVRLGELLRVHLDGVPLDLASRLLPMRTRLNFSLAVHIHWHAKAQRRYANRAINAAAPSRQMSKTAFLAMMDNLAGTVRKLKWQPRGTEWADYYAITNYSDEALQAKREQVGSMLSRITPRPQVVWDLGANTGVFRRVAAEQGMLTISWDIDPAAVEKNYRTVRAQGETRILPLLVDLTNPSPALGWAHTERESLLDRAPADVTLALALLHHLAISNNLPLPKLARFFRRTGHYLIIEFVPKNDTQVQKLLASREDIFPNYTQAHFEAAFAAEFAIRAKEPIPNTERTLYLMEAQ